MKKKLNLKKLLKKKIIHMVELTTTGFDEKEIDVKVGDTVKWSNVRENGVQKAMLIGMRECADVKSEVFENGESFSWTFTESMTCTIVDGIYTTKSMKVIVTE